MSEKILAALAKLDPANDTHWTADGLPRLDTVKILSGNPGLGRDDVTAAAPELTRATAPALAPTPATSAEPAPAATPVAGQPGKGSTAPQPGPDVPPPNDIPGPVIGGPDVPPPGDVPGPIIGPDVPGPDPSLPVEPLPGFQTSGENVGALRDELATLKLNYDDRSARIVELKEELNYLQGQMDTVHNRLVAAETIENGDSNAQYLRAQLAIMEERNEARKMVLNSGVDLAALHEAIAPSPLDQAFASRRRQR